MITECVYEMKIFVYESLAFPKKCIRGTPETFFNNIAPTKCLFINHLILEILATEKYWFFLNVSTSTSTLYKITACQNVTSCLNVTGVGAILGRDGCTPDSRSTIFILLSSKHGFNKIAYETNSQLPPKLGLNIFIVDYALY